MPRNGDEDDATLRFDDKSNTNNSEESSKTRVSTNANLEDLMKRLEKLTAKNNKLRRKVKAKSTKGGSSSSEEEDSKKEKKGRNNRDKPSYNSMFFNYDNMPSATAYISIPTGKAPYFDGTCYNQWKHCMKNYLYSISPEVWQVVCDGVDFLNDDEKPTPNQLQKIHRNAQAISILTSSIDKKEFNHIDDLDVSKDVWTTLRMAHEGSKPVGKAKVEILEGKLNRFIMYDDETSHEMFNRLKKLVNKARIIGFKEWTNHMRMERLMMAYTPMNYNVVALIHQDPAYKKVTSDDVLGRIMNHEMNIQEANNNNNLYKVVSTSKKQGIALKANKSKKKKVLIESPSEEEEEEEEEEDSEKEYDEDEMALFIKKFNKFIKKRRPYKEERKEKQRSKRVCYNCGKNGHFMAQCPYERKKEDNDKRKKFDKGYKKDKKYTKKKPYGQAHADQEWNSSDESSESESDEVATIAIKGKTSSSKSLFHKLSKHTCLMANEGKKKVKSNTPSSPKYVTSDEDTLSSDNYDSSDDDNPVPSELVKNPNTMIKGLMRQVEARDKLLEQQEELLVQERKISEELKKLIALEKGKVEKLDQ
jgi:hypothetical protein